MSTILVTTNIRTKCTTEATYNNNGVELRNRSNIGDPRPQAMHKDIKAAQKLLSANDTVALQSGNSSLAILTVLSANVRSTAALDFCTMCMLF